MIFLFPSVLLSFFLPLHHSHGVEKPVVAVLVDAVICNGVRSEDPLLPSFLFGTPLGSGPLLLHVFLDHLVDVVRCFAGHEVF